MPDNNLKYKQIGERSIEIAWPDTSHSIIEERHLKAQQIKANYGNKALVNEGYRTILIIFYQTIENLEQLIDEIKKLTIKTDRLHLTENSSWNIPVLYEQDSDDLLSISKHTLLTFESIIRKQQEATYTVDFIGFLPGFPYLSGLPDILNVPRRQTPNPKIEAGCLAIAAGQCGVYPQDSPGGWYVLGKSPLVFFDVHREQPNLLSIGDTVQFYAIDQNEFDNLKQQPKDLNSYRNG
ncbi:inhibitor of KinA [Nonlabens sp. Hel1_33_55]|uniref:5-oxoprolinase subunit B family protein n=1 Tax=Nonlabens sp. Hel1_33_55 TaxID=1336802 RepID=UPI000875B5BC|nr:carboxyltransferase domain-containing protein [Nonlabens sp. Hel1_33_55]SCX98358.1 inhibitor of KinA [Nonlabens sp. Hel1_33_55]